MSVRSVTLTGPGRGPSMRMLIDWLDKQPSEVAERARVEFRQTPEGAWVIQVEWDTDE